MFLLDKIDSLLNNITMYRLILFGLMALSAVSILLGFFRILPFSGFQLLLTLFMIITTTYAATQILTIMFKSDTNVESSYITAFILFLIIAPIVSTEDFILTILITIVAMTSKYFLAFDKKHIFNPAALACFIAGLFGFGNAIWWIGSSVLLPFVAIVGLLVVRKIRRFQLLFTFLFFSIITITIFALKNGLSLSESLPEVLTSWPVVFFGTIMLTEPLTMPYTKKHRYIYGAIVGILFGSQFSLGPLHSSPEFALIVGNLFAFVVNPKGRLILTLREKIQLAPNIYEFAFSHPNEFAFIPGQYLEWTLPHPKSDSRGVRRYFTISSSPNEDNIKLGVKIMPDKVSTFKKALLNLKVGEKMSADQLAGDFIIPKNSNDKLIFIAGGIGVTPFRSIIKTIIETGIQKDIILFYSAADPREFVYKDIFKQAEGFGVKTVYVLGGKVPVKSWTGEIGFLTEDMVKKYAPDFKERKIYLSGPVAMVNNYKNLFRSMGVSNSSMHTDYFPGF